MKYSGQMSEIDELRLRSQVMEGMVELLNTFGQYLMADTNSAEEDQLEAATEDAVMALMKKGNEGLGGHIILALIALLHSTADPDEVQRWLTDQSEEILAEAKRINGQ
jgi:hypothetical protein